MSHIDWEKSDEHKQEVMERCAVLTPAEVMDALNIGKNSVYSLLNSGALVGIRIGRSWRISADELERFVLERPKY